MAGSHDDGECSVPSAVLVGERLFRRVAGQIVRRRTPLLIIGSTAQAGYAAHRISKNAALHDLRQS